MSFPFFRQPDSMDCGPTCLRMIAQYYGKSYSLQSLREKSQIGKEGVNILGISEAAESIGFRSHCIKVNFHLLKSSALIPCILHWDQNHFVVLYKIKKNNFLVADPTVGLVRLTPGEFLQRWISDRKENGDNEGVALMLEPSEGFYHNQENEQEQSAQLAFKNIFNYLLPYKKLIFQIFFGLVIGSILQLILPFLTQSVIDIGVKTANIHFVFIILMAQLALFAGRLVVEFVRSWILLHISTRINIAILTDFLLKLMKLPVSFFDSKKTGDILQRMNDHQRIESFLTGSSINVLFSMTTLIIYSVVLAIFNTYIFIVFIISSILYACWVIIFLKKRRELDYKRFDIGSREQSLTIQIVQGMQEIKINGVEQSIRWNWERLQAKLFRLNMNGLALNQWQQSGALFLNEGKNIFITFLSATAVINGHMTLGSMIAVQYMVGQLNSPIEQLIGFVQSWQNAKISMERLNEIHNMEDEEPTSKFFLQDLPVAFTRNLTGGKNAVDPVFQSNWIHEDKTQLADNNYTREFRDKNFIHFENVTFTYSGAGNDPVLKNINFSIEKGKTTAIVGISGSGKTTLLKLLLKFYKPQLGEIKLDNISLENISHKVWRGHCGMVMQDSFIFSDSIARNIAIGVQNIDLDKLRQATKIANIDDFIDNLPWGYNTKIGAEGVGLSMGQRQRILIARSIYRNPDFIFFDEATNSLDANNERIIINNLDSFFHGRTVVVVAHRLSTVKHADQIIVLNNGSIAEKGTHQELVNLQGEYFTLVKNQLDLGE